MARALIATANTWAGIGFIRFDHAHEQRYYARLRGLLLSTLVQPTEVVARLEYVIGHFLTIRIESAEPGQGERALFDDRTAL